MLYDKTSNINADNHSTAITVDGNNNIVGLGYSAVESICYSLMKVELLQFKEITKQIIDERISEFSKIFYLQLNNLVLAQQLQHEKFIRPEFHEAIYLAQKGYVFSEFPENDKLLFINLLVEKLKYDIPEFEQIALTEGIKKIALLTKEQIEILKLIFLIHYGVPNFPPEISEIEAINKYYGGLIDEIKSLDVEHMDFIHLIYTGCVSSTGVGIVLLQDIIKSRLSKEFNFDETIKNDSMLNESIKYWNNSEISKLNFTSIGLIIALTKTKLEKIVDVDYEIFFNNFY